MSFASATTASPFAHQRTLRAGFSASPRITSEAQLASLCGKLVGVSTSYSAAEFELLNSAGVEAFQRRYLDAVSCSVSRGDDPLGEAFTTLRSAAVRRDAGAVYTPPAIVASMVDWLADQGVPDRIIDPGAGSGRFIIRAGKRFPRATLIAIEKDPLAALILRTNLHLHGLQDRAEIVVGDYREWNPGEFHGTTAFVGNPPYVRHHTIGGEWKTWYANHFRDFKIKASCLAGLHSHFYLKTRMLAKEGDFGAFITSSEWLDVNYGEALRRLLTDQLGLVALQVLEPEVEAFQGTATTAAISCFRVGEAESPVRVRPVACVKNLNGLSTGVEVERARMRLNPRWSVHLRPPSERAEGSVELGDLFRVHRGQVTGANAIWIAGKEANRLPDSVKIPAVTKAKELIEAGSRLRSVERLRRIVDLPPCLDGFSASEKEDIRTFLLWAESEGADRGYIARHRKSWWSVGLRRPAPILCTYMARRPPQFTVNECGAAHINIAHGLYPRQTLSEEILTRLVDWLNNNISTESGRTYSGGLTKFEPKEIERLRIPSLETFSE